MEKQPTYVTVITNLLSRENRALSAREIVDIIKRENIRTIESKTPANTITSIAHGQPNIFECVDGLIYLKGTTENKQDKNQSKKRAIAPEEPEKKKKKKDEEEEEVPEEKALLFDENNVVEWIIKHAKARKWGQVDVSDDFELTERILKNSLNIRKKNAFKKQANCRVKHRLVKLISKDKHDPKYLKECVESWKEHEFGMTCIRGNWFYMLLGAYSKDRGVSIWELSVGEWLTLFETAQANTGVISQGSINKAGKQEKYRTMCKTLFYRLFMYACHGFYLDLQDSSFPSFEKDKLVKDQRFLTMITDPSTLNRIKKGIDER